jgi:CheY-like chemotaxis protein
MSALQRQEARPPLSVLYVEDNPSDADLLKEALALSGAQFSLTVLKDGEAALDLLRSNSLPPDIIVLDLNLRTVPGLTVLSALKAAGRWRHIPILVFVPPYDPNAQRAKTLGADLCCTKPMDWNGWPDLIDTIRQVGTLDEKSAAARVG